MSGIILHSSSDGVAKVEVTFEDDIEDADAAAWARTTLGEVCQINPAKPKPDALPADAPVTFVPMAAVDDVTGAISAPEKREFVKVRGSYTAFQDGDVLFAKITPCMENGKAAIARDLVNGLGFGSSEFHVLRPSDRVIPEFIYHLIRQKSFRAEAKDNMTGSVGQARVPTEWLKNFEIELPPVETQREIVGLVAQVQEQMESTSDRLATIPALLKKFRQSVLAAACSGQLTADWRESSPAVEATREEVVSKRQPDTSGAPNTDELLGDVPSTWSFWSVGGLAGQLIDYRGRTPPTTDTGIPHVRTSNIKSGRVDFNTSSFVSESVYEQFMTRGIPRGGDVFFTMEAPLAEVALVPDGIKFSVAQRILLIRPRSDLLTGSYLVLAFQSPHVLHAIDGRATGSGVRGIAAKRFKPVLVPVPPMEEQFEIVRRVESLFAFADSIESRLAEATAQVERTTQAILAKAFRGDLIS